MNVQYFTPDMPGDEKPKKADKGLLTKKELMENAQKKAQKIEQSKNNGLMSKNEGKLLTNDGREILSEDNK